jgi:hypothetical protein
MKKPTSTSQVKGSRERSQVKVMLYLAQTPKEELKSQSFATIDKDSSL